MSIYDRNRGKQLLDYLHDFSQLTPILHTEIGLCSDPFIVEHCRYLYIQEARYVYISRGVEVELSSN